MCALFGRQRDINLFTTVNRELLGDVITQQCAIYKPRLQETKVNLYGESVSGKFFNDPVLLNCLTERGDQEFTSDDLGVDFTQNITFRFLREDLIDASIVPEVGDIILYYGGYYEIDNTNANQFLLGKDPAYAYNENPLNPGLEEFGSNFSIICLTHYTPADKLGIEQTRL